jgi:putative ABC transport system permease protein
MNTIFGIPTDSLLIGLMGTLALILVGIAYTAVRYPLPFRLGVRNLPRRKSQTLLIVSGLALSTLIITSALGVGDTVDYSVKVEVYDELGAIDEQVGAAQVEASPAFSFNAAPATESDTTGWFDADVSNKIAALVDGETIDGVAPAFVQTLPVFNSASNLSEAAVSIRGIGKVAGSGLAAPSGLGDLGEGEVLVNRALAEALDAGAGDELLLFKGQPSPVTIGGIVADGELAGSDPSIILPLKAAQAFFGQDGRLTAVYVSNAGDRESGASLTGEVVSRLEAVAGDLTVNAVKADQLEAAADGAQFITTLFVTFGTFSIFSGILLIFLIFTVLAAERMPELGMSRAVGLQRSDLIRQFVSEGLAYNFLASAVGAALGVGAALLLAQSLGSLLANSSLNIIPRVSLRSALIGYSLGLVITFITVSISSIRISRVNIIAAIRDLNLPTLPRERQWVLFLRPFLVWRAAVVKAGEGNLSAALRLFVSAGPKAILNFWSGLLARGPVLLALGYAFAYVGVNVAEQIGVYALGVSLFIIGIGQLAHWLRVPARLSYSFVGVALILYWALDTRSAGRLAELGTNPGDFFISGIFLVGGAIVLFLYNADSLLNLFAGALGRIGQLLPVARVAVAYPVMNKGRTATTLAMFSLIIFTLVSTTTITNTFSNFLDPISGSGDYDVMLQANLFNPIQAEELVEETGSLAAAGQIAEPEVIAAVAFGPVSAQSPEMDAAASYAVNGVDETFFATHRLELGGWARGYSSAAEVWAAVQEDPSLIVIDNYSIDRGGDPTAQRADDAFVVSSIGATSTAFDPVTVTLAGADGIAREFTIIGVINSAPNFFGATMNAAAAASLGYDQPNRFFLRLPEGADARATANALEGNFSRSGLQSYLPKVDLEGARSAIRSIFYLIQGFIGLGLLIGIAALGVVTIRAVVERRQQIGVLRAIGFTREMVQNVFLFEGVFVAGLATIIGYGLALTFAYNLYLQVAADQGLPFAPPWALLATIGAVTVVTSLITAWLPARATAKVVIAEALRYE